MPRIRAAVRCRSGTGELILDFVFLAAVYVSVVDHRGLYFWFQLERHWPWGDTRRRRCRAIH